MVFWEKGCNSIKKGNYKFIWGFLLLLSSVSCFIVYHNAGYSGSNWKSWSNHDSVEIQPHTYQIEHNMFRYPLVSSRFKEFNNISTVCRYWCVVWSFETKNYHQQFLSIINYLFLLNLVDWSIKIFFFFLFCNFIVVWTMELK